MTFRGVGYGLLAVRFGAEPAIVAQGILFGLAHGLVEALPLLVAFGIGLAWLRERQGSTIPGMLLHATFNAIALTASHPRVIRVAAIAVLALAAGAWVAYVHVWRYGDSHPLAYRLETLQSFEPAEPRTRVTTSGPDERVLITAGPRSSTGYSLVIESAVVERSRVSIVVREMDRPGRAKITYPYRLLVFPKIDKPVHVHWEGRT